MHNLENIRENVSRCGLKSDRQVSQMGLFLLKKQKVKRKGGSGNIQQHSEPMLNYAETKERCVE